MIKGFICPDKEKISKDGCFTFCRMGQRCATKAYLKEASKDRPWTGKPSVTQLLKGTCEAWLLIKEDYCVDPNKQAFAISGTQKHAQLEGQGELPEQRLEYEGITGIADDLEDKVLIDYKTAGSYKVAQVMGIKIEKTEEFIGEFYKNGKEKTKKISHIVKVDPDFGDYDWQLNMYRVMYQANGHEIESMKIFFIVRDGGTFIATNRGIDKNIYFVDVPTIPDNNIIAYFIMKKEALINAVNNDIYPAMCDYEETWQGRKCEGYCAVRDICKYNLNGG